MYFNPGWPWTGLLQGHQNCMSSIAKMVTDAMNVLMEVEQESTCALSIGTMNFDPGWPWAVLIWTMGLEILLEQSFWYRKWSHTKDKACAKSEIRIWDKCNLRMQNSASMSIQTPCNNKKSTMSIIRRQQCFYKKSDFNVVSIHIICQHLFTHIAI